MTHYCPHCRQPMRLPRAGVQLPLIKSLIFDAVKSSSSLGIASIDILHLVYEGRKRPNFTAVKSHVNQINDILVETGFVIKSEGGRWFLRRRK